MIIPIRCISCNNPFLASRWELYLQKVKEYRKAEGKTDMEYLTATTTKTAEGKALDDVKITRMCCRTRMLTHVDLI
jgi:DNA-directed RNA polymerase subunit N (RpoN/RPB10)